MLRYWESPETTAVHRLRPQPVAESAAMALDGTWRFQLLSAPDAEPGRDWAEVTVPSLWTMGDFGDPPQYTNVQMPFDEQPPVVPAHNPTGVYEREFPAPVDWRSRNTVLRVGGFEGVLRVELNGALVGIAKDGRIASEFVLDAMLIEGDNRLRLVVSKWSDATFIEDQDQWWHAGISRSVELLSRPATHLEHLDLTPTLDGAAGRLRIRAGLSFAAGRSQPGHALRVRVEDLGVSSALMLSDGIPRGPETDADRASMLAWFTSEYAVEGTPHDARTLLQRAEPMPAGHCDATVEFEGVEPWSAEAPRLYTVVIEHLDAAGEVCEQFVRRVGFRSVAVTGHELLVNGRAVMIRGVNRHDFHRRTGKVLTEHDIRADLEELKRWNVNAIRTSHYPNDPALLRLADELGFYVVAEANLESHAFMHSICDDPRYLNAFVDRVSRLVMRDQHHASVILWSLGNESGYGANHDAAASWVRRFDPTRPLHYEGAIRGDWTAGHRATDIVCPMYPSIDAIVRYATSGTLDRPLIMCEYSHAMGNSNGSLADYWGAIEAHPGLQGGFIWEMWDHGLVQRTADGLERYAYGGDFGETRHDGNFCCDGLFFPDRTAKPAMHEFKQLSAPIVVEEMSTVAGEFRLRNRQHFSDTSGFSVVWTITNEGSLLLQGEVDVPCLAPGDTATFSVPEVAARTAWEGERLVDFSIRRREATVWSPPDFEVGWAQFALPGGVARAELITDTPKVVVAADGRITFLGLRIAPQVCLWRAPTDNDRIGGVAASWEAWGLPKIRREVTGRESLPDGGVMLRSQWQTSTGYAVEHHQVITPCPGGVQVREHVFLPPQLDDVARVGTVLALPSCRAFEWFGSGPFETYPDRHLSRIGRWSAEADDVAVPYVRPQENGARVGVRWLELEGEKARWRITTDEPRLMSFTPYEAQELAAATHWSELPKPSKTIVHIDAAHRGVGTASCGPDALPQYRVPVGVHAWTWRLQRLP